MISLFFFFNDTATTEIYTLSLHDALPISSEIRPIIGWHLGRLDLIFNPILDNSYDGFPGLDFAPPTRIAFNFSKAWAFAAEEYDDFGPLRHFYASAQQAHQLFGVVDYRTRSSLTP